MAVSWLRLLRSQRLGRFQSPLALLLRRFGMRCGLLCPAPAMRGSMATGEFMAGGMYGFRACGSGLLMLGPTGAIRTTITTPTAGRCMKAIGTMRTMATITMSTMTIITVARRDVSSRKRPGFRRVFSLFYEAAKDVVLFAVQTQVRFNRLLPLRTAVMIAAPECSHVVIG